MAFSQERKLHVYAFSTIVKAAFTCSPEGKTAGSVCNWHRRQSCKCTVWAVKCPAWCTWCWQSLQASTCGAIYSWWWNDMAICIDRKTANKSIADSLRCLFAFINAKLRNYIYMYAWMTSIFGLGNNIVPMMFYITTPYWYFIAYCIISSNTSRACNISLWNVLWEQRKSALPSESLA